MHLAREDEARTEDRLSLRHADVDPALGVALPLLVLVREKRAAAGGHDHLPLANAHADLLRSLERRLRILRQLRGVLDRLALLDRRPRRPHLEGVELRSGP